MLLGSWRVLVSKRYYAFGVALPLLFILILMKLARVSFDRVKDIFLVKIRKTLVCKIVWMICILGTFQMRLCHFLCQIGVRIGCGGGGDLLGIISPLKLAQGGRINSACYLWFAFVRKHLNWITWINNSHDFWCNSKGSITEVVVKYFANLFFNNHVGDPSHLYSIVINCISNAQNLSLLSDFQAKEVQEVVKHMGPKNASRSIGLPTLFYQHYQSFLSSNITTFCLLILNGVVCMDYINHMNIVLILKTFNPHLM